MSTRALGGAETVTRAMLRRAGAQAVAIGSAGGSWEYVGADNIGGRVTDVVADPTQPDTIFVASAGGGVWKSSDAGLTYTAAWPEDYPQAIGALARGPDGTLWAGTGEANASGGGITYVGDGVYKSTDAGSLRARKVAQELPANGPSLLLTHHGRSKAGAENRSRLPGVVG
jgi:hypothetical protein